MNQTNVNDFNFGKRDKKAEFMTFQEWWIDPNARMPFPATGADLQEWCRQAFMAGADAANNNRGII